MTPPRAYSERLNLSRVARLNLRRRYWELHRSAGERGGCVDELAGRRPNRRSPDEGTVLVRRVLRGGDLARKRAGLLASVPSHAGSPRPARFALCTAAGYRLTTSSRRGAC